METVVRKWCHDEIVEAMRGQGLEVEWDGTWARRIFVMMEWKRRVSGGW
jgi:hypothetical protein